MTTEQALALIESFGGDPRRWPDAERAALLALAGHDARVSAAIADARELDTLLVGWALAETPAWRLDDAALAALTAPRALPPRALPPRALPLRPLTLRPLPLRRWFAGGAMAAALAAGVVLVNPLAPRTGHPMVAAATPLSSHAPNPDSVDRRADAAFGDVFTPTADEEELI